MKVPSPVTGRTQVPSTGTALLRADGASPRAFGALSMPIPTGLGEAIGNLGAAFSRVAQRQEAVDRTRTLRDMSQFNTDLDIRMNELQRGTAFDEGHYFETASGVIDNEVNKFLADKVPPHLQEEFAARAEAIRDQSKRRAYDWGIEQEDTFFRQTVTDAETRATNGFTSGRWTREEAEAHIDEAIDATDLSDIEKTTRKLELRIKIASLDYGRAIESEMRNSNVTASKLIMAEEAFRGDAYADHVASTGEFDAWRAGFGSDIVVRQDGTVEKVTKDTQVSRADALRTLDYRLTNEFIPRAMEQVGSQEWNTLPPNARAGLTSVIWNYGSLPNSVIRAAKTGDVEQIANAVESLSANKERRQREADIIRSSVGAYKRADFERVPTYRDQRGLWYASNIGYDIDGKIRDKPVSKGFVQTLSGTLRAINPRLGAVIVSAGQDDEKRTGSHRHDVDSTGEAHTGDLVLLKDGKRIAPGDDKELYAKVMEELAAAGFTGIGHYSWGIHVGGGKRAAWGPSTTSSDLDPEFQAAIERGWARHQQGVDGDPRFAMVPWETRVAAQEDARTRIARDRKAQEDADKALNEELMNQTLVGIRSGAVGRGGIDELVSSGKISNYDDMVKLDNALEKYQKDQGQAQMAAEMLASPTGVFDPNNTDHKNALNAYVGEAGRAAIRNTDQEYFAQTILPTVRKAQDIPTDIAGLLTGLFRSNDLKRMGYAVDALALLEQVAPDAYEHRIPDHVKSDVRYWRDRKDRMNQEELMRQINGGLTPSERQARQQLRNDGKTLLRDNEWGLSRSELVSEFDGWFSRTPEMAGEAWQQAGLVKDYQTLFLDEYEKRGVPEEAKTEALRQLKLMWGVTNTGGKNQLMKYPPERMGYRPVNGTYDYISEDVRTTLNIPPDSDFFLISDDETRKSAQNGPASYNVVTQDADGVFHPALTEDGAPARMYFEPSARQVAQEERDFEIREKLTQVREEYKDYERAMQHYIRTGTPIPPDVDQAWREAQAELVELYKTSPKDSIFDRLEKWNSDRLFRMMDNQRRAEDRYDQRMHALSSWWVGVKDRIKSLSEDE